jgi:transposase InsO family protein
MTMESSLHPKCSDISLYTIRLRISKYQIHSYPQLQGKIEAYNKIVKNEFLAIEEDIPNIDDGKLRYDDMFIKVYNETREHGGINGLTPSEMFLQRLITSTISIRTKQQSVTHVGT